MKKSISVIAACVGAPLLVAGIAIPSASADPTNSPSPPAPTAANQPPLTVQTYNKKPSNGYPFDSDH
jgi:hypothetical protein